MMSSILRLDPHSKRMGHLRFVTSLIFLATAISLLWVPVASAHVPADGSIHATLGPLVYTTHERSHQFETYPQAGVGLVVEGDLDQHGGLEMSLQYIQKIYSVRTDDKNNTEAATRMYITTGYRHWWNPKYSGAIAFFSSYSMGEPETIKNQFGSQPAPPTSAHDATDYGFDFSLQAEPISFGRYALIFDVRYSLSVTPKAGEDSNHYGGIVALKYFVQGRDDPGASATSR